MPQLRTYHIFIAHAWRYGEQYQRIVKMLADAPMLTFVNWSAPEDKPVIPPGAWAPAGAVLEAIAAKMRMAQIVLVLSGMYAAHSDWMKAEMELAKRIGVPMIGIR